MTDRDRTFAAGRCKIDGFECPVFHADVDRPGLLMSIAHVYDQQINQLMDDDLLDGYNAARVSEEYAKEAWLDAIDELEAQDRDDDADDAREVARDLGWLDA